MNRPRHTRAWIPNLGVRVRLSRGQFLTLRHVALNVPRVGGGSYKADVLDALLWGRPARSVCGPLIEAKEATAWTETPAGRRAAQAGVEGHGGGGAIEGRRVWVLTARGRQVLRAFCAGELPRRSRACAVLGEDSRGDVLEAVGGGR